MLDMINICLDIGGTYVKGMAYDNANVGLIDGINYYEAHSELNKEGILQNFVTIIEDLYSQVISDHKLLTNILLAFPGPFDYEQGISLIKGLGKYDSLYGVNIPKKLTSQISQLTTVNTSNNLAINIFNDGEAFAFGEYHDNNLKHQKGAYFTLGTGCGSTFIEKNKPVAGKYGIPESGMIFNEKFKSSIIDDYISARGLSKIITTIFGESLQPEKVFALAENDQDDALKVFDIFGENIGLALIPFLIDFKPDEIVFGGQISKSFKYMRRSMLKILDEKSLKINVRVSKNTSLATIQGLNSLKNLKEGFVNER